jgi:hypothetical protein
MDAKKVAQPIQHPDQVQREDGEGRGEVGQLGSGHLS